MPTERSPGEGLASTPAQRRHERLALGVAAASLAIFAALAPFAKVQFERLPAFIPLYQSALVITDLVTAALLFAQCRVAPTRPLLLLACGYLFTALMIVAHTLSFPDLLAPQGVIGGGAQTTAWLYMFWHALFPAFVAAYAVSRPAPIERREVVAGIGATLAAALAIVALAGPGEALLPAIMAGHGYLPAYRVVVAFVWLCSVAGLVLLWRKRPRTVLDVWAMVVLCVWTCEIALAAVLNQGRFDLGFYAGRIYGFAAASFLLGVLILFAITPLARASRMPLHNRFTIDCGTSWPLTDPDPAALASFMQSGREGNSYPSVERRSALRNVKPHACPSTLTTRPAPPGKTDPDPVIVPR